MSLQSENRSQKNSTLDKLVSSNAEAVSKIGLTPYEMPLYAIPKEQRDAEFRLLQEAWKFQPELYKRIELLATMEDLEEYGSQMEKQAERAMQRGLNRLSETNRETVTQMQSLIAQDGKMQEKFISDSSRALDSRIADLNGEIRRLKKTGIWFMIGTMISSVILSGLASALLLRLLG